MPAKQRLDQEYAAKATFLSDLKLLFKTLSRQWDLSIMESLLTDSSEQDGTLSIRSKGTQLSATMRPVLITSDRGQNVDTESAPPLALASESQSG